MKKLLSVFLIFALLFNTTSPAWSEIWLLRNDLETAIDAAYNFVANDFNGWRDENSKLGDYNVQTVLPGSKEEWQKLNAIRDKMLALIPRYQQVVDEIYTARDQQDEAAVLTGRKKLEALEKEFEGYRKEMKDLYISKKGRDEQYANSRGYGRAYRGGDFDEEAMVVSSSMDKLQHQIDSGFLRFQDLIDYVRPEWAGKEGKVFKADSTVTALAAQQIGNYMTLFQGDKEVARRFVNNELFHAPGTTNYLYATDLRDIQTTMLTRLMELHALPEDQKTVEDVQAIGSLRIAVLRVLQFYENTGIPNYLYYYKPSAGERATGQETLEQRKASQQRLKQDMYNGFINDLKAYGKKSGENDIAKMTLTGSFAVLYSLIYKPNNMQSVFTLMEAVPYDSDKPRQKASWRNPKTGTSYTTYWEHEDNKTEQKYNAVHIAMIRTLSDYYRNSEHALPERFYKEAMSRTAEKGRNFPLLVRITAMEEAASFAPARGSSLANLIAYQALTMYCPLNEQGHKVYGLDSGSMTELALSLKEIWKGTWASPDHYGNRSTPSFYQSLPNGGPLSEIFCPITDDRESNINQDAVDMEYFLAQVEILGEAIFWIYGGAILSGVFKILRTVALLPFNLARSVRVGYTVYKDAKLLGVAEKTIEFTRIDGQIAEKLVAEMGNFADRYGTVLNDAKKFVDPAFLQKYEKVINEADDILLNVQKRISTPVQYRNAAEIQKVGNEMRSLTSEAKQLRSEIKQLEEALKGATNSEKAIQLEQKVQRLREIEASLQRASKTLQELSTGRKVTQATSAVVSEVTGTTGETAISGAVNGVNGAVNGAGQAARVTEQTAAQAFTNPATIEESYTAYEGAYESAFRRAAKAAGRNFADEVIGNSAIKGFLRRNGAQLVVEVRKGETVEHIVVKNNRALRRLWREAEASGHKLTKAFVRQNTLASPSIFELSQVPKGYAELGQLVRGAKASAKAAEEAGAIEEGFRRYTWAQSKALNEIVQSRARIADHIAKDGGVDIYVEVEAPGVALEKVVAEDGTASFHSPLYWNTAKELPEGYVPRMFEEGSKVYIVPKGTQMEIATGEVLGETLAQKGMAVTYEQLEKSLVEAVVDQVSFRIAGGTSKGVLSKTIDFLTPKFLRSTATVTPAAAAQGAAVANLAVSPVKVVWEAAGVNRPANLFKWLISSPLPKTRTSAIFAEIAAPKFMREVGLGSFYYYASKAVTSNFAMNLIFFEIFEAADHSSLLRSWQTSMLTKFQERDKELALAKYPHLKKALEEEENNLKDKSIAEILQESRAKSDDNFRGLPITLLLYPARRFFSDLRSASGTSSWGFLDASTISDVQELQFEMREKQLIIQPAFDHMIDMTNLQLMNESIEKQVKELLESDNTKALSKSDPNLSSSIRSMGDDYLRDVREVFDKKYDKPQDKTDALKRAGKNFEKRIHDRYLKAEEKSYDNTPGLSASDKAAIKESFKTYRQKAQEIYDNPSYTPEQRQEKLEEPRRQLTNSINEKINESHKNNVLNSPAIQQIIAAEGGANKSTLKKKIDEAFKTYADKQKSLLRNSNSKDKSSQERLKKDLEEAQRKLNEEVATQISEAQERLSLNAPDVQKLIEAEGGKQSSKLAKEIHDAYEAYRKKESALMKKHKGTDAASQNSLKKSLEAEQINLSVAIQTSILNASLRAFKKDPNMQAFIEIDNSLEKGGQKVSFEKQLDNIFNEHIKNVTAVLKDTTLTQDQKAQKFQTLQTNFTLKIFDLQIDMTQKMDAAVNPEIIMLSAAYPELKDELGTLYDNYKKDHATLIKQALPAEKTQEEVQKQEKAFLDGKRDIVQKYYLQGLQDMQFWTNVAKNVTLQQWSDIAAMRQSQNLMWLLQMIPDLDKNIDKSNTGDGKSPLIVIEEELTKFMQMQVDFYNDSSITNMDIVMRALMLEEDRFKGQLAFLCGDKKYMEQYSTETFQEEAADEEEAAADEIKIPDAEIDKALEQQMQQQPRQQQQKPQQRKRK